MESPEEAERRYLSLWIRHRRESDNMRKIPPREIVRHLDIFEKAWGWERLLPYEIGTAHFYLDYLKEYLRRNGMDYVAAANGNSKPEDWPLKARPVYDVTRCSQDGDNALAAAAKFGVAKEARKMCDWMMKENELYYFHSYSLFHEMGLCDIIRMATLDVMKHILLSSTRNRKPYVIMDFGNKRNKSKIRKIQERACFIICTGPEFSQHAAASLVCIAKEAALACELLRRGAEATHRAIMLCNCIRQCALSLMIIEGPDSDASAAAMVGVAKEARKMCDWMRKENELYEFHFYSLFHEMGLCDIIRMATLDVMKHILSSCRRNSKPYVIMDFGNKRNKSKSRKTRAGTSNTHLSQEQPHERKYILEQEMKVEDKDVKLDALTMGHQTENYKSVVHNLKQLQVNPPSLHVSVCTEVQNSLRDTSKAHGSNMDGGVHIHSNIPADDIDWDISDDNGIDLYIGEVEQPVEESGNGFGSYEIIDANIELSGSEYYGVCVSAYPSADKEGLTCDQQIC